MMREDSDKMHIEIKYSVYKIYLLSFISRWSSWTLWKQHNLIQTLTYRIKVQIMSITWKPIHTLQNTNRCLKKSLTGSPGNPSSPEVPLSPCKYNSCFTESFFFSNKTFLFAFAGSWCANNQLTTCKQYLHKAFTLGQDLEYPQNHCIYIITLQKTLHFQLLFC